MAALLKYLVGIVIILSAVVILFAVNMSEILGGIAAIAQAPATETPRWNIERQQAKPETPHVARAVLSPIYPATPGKELLGKPVYTARLAKKHKERRSAKRIDVRQALQLHKAPRQIYSADLDDKNYPQQSLSYVDTDTRLSQPRQLIIFGHGIY